MDLKIVTAALIIKHNTILIAKRAHGKSLAGYWEFPGGKLESGEDTRYCLKRELLEELSVEATIGEEFTESIYQYTDGAIKLIAIYASLLTDKFELKVHDEVVWAQIDDLLNYRLAPADISIANKVIEIHGFRSKN